MKNIRLYVAIALSAVFFSSCEEEYGNAKMHTTINADGSCTRSISFNKKSKHNGIAVGSEWKELSSDTVTATYTRTFCDAEQMSHDIPLILNGQPLKSNATVDKKFRWFYTEYAFTEVYESIQDKFPLPPTLYADSAMVSTWFVKLPELSKIMNGSELLNLLTSIGHRMDDWLGDNLTYSAVDYIYAHYDSVVNPPVSREQFVQMRDSLANFLRKQANGDFLWYDHKKGVKEFFNSDAYSVFFDEGSTCCKDFYHHLNPIVNFSNLNVNYTLTMPGEIVSTGNGFYSDGTIHYVLSGERLIPDNYVISATSRVTNYWAYVATVLVILLAIVSGVLYHKKTK